MAAQPPRPFGLQPSQALDAGTLSRIANPLPSPTSLFAGKGTSPRLAPRALHSLEIHKSSRISADAWLAKINACKEVGNFDQLIKGQISAQGRLILVPSQSAFNINPPVRANTRIMFDDWLSAFAHNDWVMTTGCSNMTLQKGGPKGTVLTSTIVPDLGPHDDINMRKNGVALNTTTRGDNLGVELGVTLTEDVKLSGSRQRLIVIADRYTLLLGNKSAHGDTTLRRTFPQLQRPLDDFSTTFFQTMDSELVMLWFHELACHAGRDSAGKKDVENDHAFAPDIEAMIPSDEPKRLHSLITGYLNKP